MDKFEYYFNTGNGIVDLVLNSLVINKCSLFDNLYKLYLALDIKYSYFNIETIMSKRPHIKY